MVPQLEVKKLTIDRETWLRGEGSSNSFLRRAGDGKQCCLGFYCLARGLSAEEITDSTTPDIVGINDIWLQKKYAGGQRRVQEVLMSTNDMPLGSSPDGGPTRVQYTTLYSEAEREAVIASIFRAEGGVEVVFV
jgi:hypothetical protein